MKDLTARILFGGLSVLYLVGGFYALNKSPRTKEDDRDFYVSIANPAGFIVLPKSKHKIQSHQTTNYNPSNLLGPTLYPYLPKH
jgi:hypothetical protein